MSVLAVAPRQTAVLPYRNSSVSAQQEVSLPQQSSDQVTLSSGDDKVGWGDAAVGLVGAVAGAAIETVGNTASAVYHSAIGTAEAYRSLLKTDAIGPWIKGSIAMLIPVATVAVPVLAAIGSAGVGLYRGFTQGIDNGLGGAIEAGVNDVKSFHSETAVDVRKSIREFADQKPEAGQEPFDISPVDGAIGFAAGIVNTVAGGIGIGVSTLSQIPEAFITANRAIAKSDMGLPLKTVSHLVSLPLAVVAAPLGFVGGALFGLGSGAYYGYKEGFTEACSKTGDHVEQYHQIVDDGLAKLAEHLVEG